MHDFVVWESWRPRLRDQGLRTMKDILERSEVVRDLPDRVNARLYLDDAVVHVKRRKRRPFRAVENLELAGLVAAADAGIPVPELVFAGTDARLGAVTGTLDLAPARPLDDLLQEGTLGGAARVRVGRALADVVAALHAGGRHHRDLYLNHVYVDPARPGVVAGIIDWDRAGTHGGVLGRREVKDLAALASSLPLGQVTERETNLFLRRYARRRGLAGRGALRRLERRVRRKADRIRAHAPRTPVGDAARPPDRGARA